VLNADRMSLAAWLVSAIWGCAGTQDYSYVTCMRRLGMIISPVLVIRIFDSPPTGDFWRAFRNYDEVENAPENSSWGN
jgi:hypothetical protein